SLGQISREKAEEALRAPVTARLHAANIEVEAPYLAEMVREQMVKQHGEKAYTGGFKVYTTIDSRLQETANQALRRALEDYDRRHGWRGPEAHLEPLPSSTEERHRFLAKHKPIADLLPALVTSVSEKEATVYVGNLGELTLSWESLRWARPYIDVNKRGPKPKTAREILKAGDLVRVQARTDEEGKTRWELAQVPDISGALVSLDPHDGAILALVGGYDFYSSKFNRVTQARRQPGSGFKAIIYSAALEAGFTAASIINDAPVVIEDDGSGNSWRPENYSGKFFGPTRLRLALTKSRNLVSIRLLRSMRIAHVLEHAKRFGFAPDDLPHGLSLALGSGEVSPLQMARAYAVLANGGYLVEPYFIQRIEQKDEILYQAEPLLAADQCPAARPDCRLAPRTLNEENRYIMYSMLQDVITRGTGWRARELGRKDLAGKTGTTNEQRDAWFNGFNQQLVAIVWTGFDDNRKLGKGEVGGKVALPAWMAFMKTALKEIPDQPPEMPPSLITARIDKCTGLRVARGGENTLFEVFRPGREPPLMDESPPAWPSDSAQPAEAADADDLF
ncbi:MAG TPA: peptidase, partial [Chromatiaceae bacterium]|nr:peptidase [Chromatiaceae bacterium]